MVGGVFIQLFNKHDVSLRCVDVIDTWILLKSKHRFFSVKKRCFLDIDEFQAYLSVGKKLKVTDNSAN